MVVFSSGIRGGECVDIRQCQRSSINRDLGSQYTGSAKYWSNDKGVMMRKGGVLTYKISVPVDGKYKLTYVYGNGTGILRRTICGYMYCMEVLRAYLVHSSF